MHRIVFHFDVVSPYAYLAFERLPDALQDISADVAYRPLLFAGLLRHWGTTGPAETEPKRQWTFRQVHWLAQQHGVPLDTPAEHPFNPLAVLRLLVAAGPNRRTAEAALHHVWRGGGADANDPARLAALASQLGVSPQAAEGDAVKARLRGNTDQAGTRGIFGVPTFELADGRLFWGLDALPMLRGALLGEPWFAGPAWADAGAPRVGVGRGGQSGPAIVGPVC